VRSVAASPGGSWVGRGRQRSICRAGVHRRRVARPGGGMPNADGERVRAGSSPDEADGADDRTTRSAFARSCAVRVATPPVACWRRSRISSSETASRSCDSWRPRRGSEAGWTPKARSAATRCSTRSGTTHASVPQCAASRWTRVRWRDRGPFRRPREALAQVADATPRTWHRRSGGRLAEASVRARCQWRSRARERRTIDRDRRGRPNGSSPGVAARSSWADHLSRR
jgi:hypothetical protein